MLDTELSNYIFLDYTYSECPHGTYEECRRETHGGGGPDPCCLCLRECPHGTYEECRRENHGGGGPDPCRLCLPERERHVCYGGGSGK